MGKVRADCTATATLRPLPSRRRWSAKASEPRYVHSTQRRGDQQIDYGAAEWGFLLGVTAAEGLFSYLPLLLPVVSLLQLPKFV